MKPVTFATGMLLLGSTIALADTCLLFVCFFPCSSGFLYLLILLEFAANFVLKIVGPARVHIAGWFETFGPSMVRHLCKTLLQTTERASHEHFLSSFRSVTRGEIYSRSV